MTARHGALVLLAILAAATPGRAEAPAFRHARPVTPAGRGPQALPVDVPLLTGAASSRLDDLRLFDAEGREVPWLLVPPADPSPRWRPAARVLPVAATKEESGLEADLGAPALVDRLRLEGLGAPLLKRYRLEGSGDRSRWTLLVPDGTLFDLPGESLRLLEASFPAVEVRYVRVTWDDRKSARPPLPARVAAREAGPRPVPASVKVPAAFERRSSEPGKSRFAIRLPGPRLPLAALELGVSSGPLLREARVLESRLSANGLAPVELGRSTLRRAERDGVVAADLRIPLRPAEGTDLDLVVDDGDNPPLALSEVRLDLGPLPFVYFESASGAPLTARFGAPALGAPRYDLEAKRAAIERSRAADAAWGARADLAPAPAAAAPLPPAGAPLDAARFRFRRSVPAPGSGLVSLGLDAAVLAHSKDLADLRLVDGSGLQVPYLLEQRDEPLAVELPPLRAEAVGRRGERNLTRYPVALPFDSLPPARLVLGTTATVFDRSVRLLGRRPTEDPRSEPVDETLAAARWTHADPETPAPPLVLAFSPAGFARVTVEVDEGDNSPLPLGTPRLLLPSWRLRFFPPAEGSLTLCYGVGDVAAPRYDMALLAPRLAGAGAREVALAGEAAPAPPSERPATERRLFWASLAAAVAALLVVTGRLLMRPPGAIPPAGTSSPS